MRDLIESIKQMYAPVKESVMSEVDLTIRDVLGEGGDEEDAAAELAKQFDVSMSDARDMVIDWMDANGGLDYTLEAVSDSDKVTMNIHAKQARPEVERTKAVSRQYGGEKAAKNVEHGFRSAFKRKYKKLDTVEETRFATSGGNYKTGTYHVVVDGKAVSSHSNKAIATVARDKIVKQSPEMLARVRVKHESELLESQDEASKAGFTAGFSGKPRQNPYEKNTKDYLRWDQEYQMGAEDRAYEKNGFRPSRPMPKVTRESTLAEEGKEYSVAQEDGEWVVKDATGNIVDTATDKLGAMQAARDLNKMKPTNRRVIQGKQPEAEVEEAVQDVAQMPIKGSTDAETKANIRKLIRFARSPKTKRMAKAELDDKGFINDIEDTIDDIYYAFQDWDMNTAIFKAKQLADVVQSVRTGVWKEVEEDFKPGQYGSTLEEIIRAIAKKYLNTDLDSDSSIGDGSVGGLNAALGDAFVAGYHKGQQRAGVKPVQESSEDYYTQNAKRLEQAAEQVRVFLYDDPRISSDVKNRLESDLANAEEYFDIADPDDVEKAEKYLSSVESFFMDESVVGASSRILDRM